MAFPIHQQGPGQIVPGMLYLGPNRNGLKMWSQPDPGGLVYPQFPVRMPWNAPSQGTLYSWPFAYSGLYAWGCGHWSNTAEIFQGYDKYLDEILAYITCPMCSFVQETMPLAQYQSYLQTPIIVA